MGPRAKARRWTRRRRRDAERLSPGCAAPGAALPPAPSMMRVAPRMSIWEGRFEDKLSFCIADLVMLPMAVLTAKVDDLLREWGGEGPVNQYLQAAIAGEHEALVLRLVGLARAEGRSLGWLVDFLRIAEDMKPGAAVLPPAAYRAKRLGRPDPGGTWHRATVWRMLRRLDFLALLADTRQALARIVREAVLPDLYSRGLDWAAGQLNREGVPTEHQTRRELSRLRASAGDVGRGSGSRRSLSPLPPPASRPESPPNTRRPSGSAISRVPGRMRRGRRTSPRRWTRPRS